MTTNQAATTFRLRCIGCDQTPDGAQPDFRCAHCGDLLEFHFPGWTYDPASLRALWLARRISIGKVPGKALDQSGVWRFRELLPPIAEEHVISMGEGNTPLYHLQRCARATGIENLYAKHQGMNPTASFKDTGMTAAASAAHQAGFRWVACASTGNTSASMAAYAARGNMRSLVLIPEGKISWGKLSQALDYGALTCQLRTDFDGCVRILNELVRQKPVYLLNSVNPCRIEGQKTAAIELLEQLGWESPDHIIVPGGNLGNSSAIGKALLEMRGLNLISRLPKLSIIQARGANPFYRCVREFDGAKLEPMTADTMATAIRIGNPASWRKAAKVIEGEYLTSLNIHAPLEPMNALAMEENGTWHIYTGNQFNTRTTLIAAAVASVDAKNIVIHQHYLGGGFGRRLESDMTVPAVAAAKAVGKPVKLIYAREDDMQMDFTRPLTYQKVKVGLDAEGHAIAMEHDVIGAWPTARWGIPAFLTPAVDKKGPHDSFTVNGADYWYTIPNHTVRNFENKLAQNATPSGQLRSVAPGWTFWAVESTMDDIAHATGQDPVEMRLKLLDGAGANAGGDKPQNIGGAKRLANVLRIAVGRAGYGALKLGENEGIGVACVSSQERTSPTWTACVAHVKVDPKSGDVTLKKLTLAMDVGTVVNPDGVRAQIEGSTLWGASIAMLEKATMENGGIQQTNFDGYTPMRLSQVPELDISIVGNGEPAVGCGEPAVTVVAPAIGNAIFNAVGARVRSLPITAEAVKAAMKS